MGTYILSSGSEAERLERQSTLEAYDYNKDFSDLAEQYRVILDAGTGSGVVARYLANRFKDAQVVAVDSSETLLQEARKLASGIENISFEKRDLKKTHFEDHSFDLIVSRYVLEHQKPLDLKKMLLEFHRILKPGGRVQLVDVDGCMFNLYPTNKVVEQGLERLKKCKELDLFVGRKIPFLLEQAGFSNVSYQIETSVFKGELLRQEITQMQERFSNGEAFFSKVLGGKSKLKIFEKNYLEMMSKSNAVLFYNKFIASAFKTGTASLKLV